MLKDRAWVLAIVISLIVPALVLNFNDTAEGNYEIVGPPTFVFLSFPPFSIENDTSLIENSSLNGWTGSGNPNDPIVIKDLNIDGSNGIYAVRISNTTLYLEFSNCTFWNTANDNNETYSGLRLENTSNIIVNGCKFNTSRSGIYSMGSDVFLKNSTFDSNYVNGVLGYNSNFTILNNTFVNNFYAVYLEDCESPDLLQNNITNNYYGISAGSSRNGTFEINNVEGQTSYGINLHSGSINWQLKNNSFIRNSDGALLEDRSVIYNDTFQSNDDGIWMYGDDIIIDSVSISGGTNGIVSTGRYYRGMIKNSTILNCENGIDLRSCEYFQIRNNTISNCRFYGIDLYLWNHHSHIENNTISSSYSTAGARLRYDYYCTIIDNQFSNSITGAYIQDIYYSEVRGNSFRGCSETGVKMITSDYTTVTDNELSNNTISGFSIENTDYALISNNDIENSQIGIEYEFDDFGSVNLNRISGCNHGITARGSDGGFYENNTIKDCNSYGMTHSESSNNKLVNNTIMKTKFFAVNMISSSNNLLYNNAFAYNNRAGLEYNSSSRQAQDNFDTNKWYRDGRGNFWRDHTTPDADLDGIVDIPYQINGMMNQDPYPLTSTGFLLVPSRVPNISALPYNGRVDLNWDEPLFDGGSSITRYNIYGKNSTGKFRLINFTGPSITSYSDPEVVNRDTYSYRIAAVNNIGEGPFSPTVFATPDDSEPVIAFLSPSPGSFINSGSVYVSWKGTDALKNIAEFSIKWDSGDWLSKGLSTDHTIDFGSNGPHNITVKAVDTAGNTNSSTIDFIIDTEKPNLTIHRILNGSWINSTTAHFEWTMEDTYSGIDHIEIRWDDVYWLNKDMSTNITIKNLGEGSHMVYFKIFDNAGNEFMETVNFSIDLADPEIWFEYPDPEAKVNSPDLLIEWMGIDHASGTRTFMVKVDNGDWTDAGIVYNTTVDLKEDGEHTVHLKIIDRAGNQAVTTLEVTLDREIPKIMAYGPQGEQIEPSSAEIFIQFDEVIDLNNIDISINGILGTVIWSVDNVMFFTPREDLRYGTTYEVSISGKDLAGNSLVPFTWRFSTDNRGYVKGRVLDKLNYPVNEAVITVVDNNTTGTDGAGNFILTVGSGQKTIHIDAPGYVRYSKDITVIAGETYDLGPVKLEEKVDMGTIRGKVVDEDGKPLLGVIVTLDTGETNTTPEDGTFEFHVEVENYTISFVRDGFDRHVETAWVKKDQVADLEIVELVPSDGGKKTDDDGLELWQLQLIVFIVIIVIGIVAIYIILRRSGKGVEAIGEE